MRSVAFQPPYASHRGGVWERLIRSSRRILGILCRNQTMTDESLATALAEVERVLNNRPIVPAATTDSDSLALTPNDLLLLRGNGRDGITDSLIDCYRHRWKQARHLATVFWKRWSSEYITSLSLRQKWLSTRRNFQVGDVVLVSGETPKYKNWPLGIIVDVHADEDGHVRTVQVRTREGIVVRDIRRLCLLEGVIDTPEDIV